MVGKIIYSPLFISELDDLAKVLYQQKYFSFVEDVDVYIDKIYDFIEGNIAYPISRNSTKKFLHYARNFFAIKPTIKLLGIYSLTKKATNLLSIIFLITIR